MTNKEKIQKTFPDIWNKELSVAEWEEWFEKEYQEPKSEWEHDHEILKAYSDGANEVLNKVRAEIKALSPEPTAFDVVDGNPIKDAVWEILADVLQIIDKYKGESEG